MHAVGFAIIHRDPIGIKLGGRIGRARIERRRFRLRNLLDLAEHLRGRGLVEPHAVLEAENADRLEQAQGTDGVGIGGVFGGLEAHLDMALGGQIVDLRRPHLLDDPDQAGAVGEVTVMELEADIGLVQVAVEVVDPSGVEGRGAPLDAVDFIALAQQQFGEIGAVLSGHAGDQCDLAGHGLFASGSKSLGAAGRRLTSEFRRMS
jgi:hypothetical protein